MHVITRKRLIDFAKRYPSARKPLLAWFSVMRASRFRNHNELKGVFGSVDVIAGSRVVFDIGGNKYRLIADIVYKIGRVFIRAVMTHEEYDRTDVRRLK